MKKIILHILFLLGMFSSLHGEDLLNKYKKKMDTTYTDLNNEISKNENTSKVLRIKSIFNEIKTIHAMKKNTFESTNDFKERRNKAVLIIDDKTNFYFTKGSQEYSAGTVQMKRYNPDTQIMVLVLSWNKEVVSLISEMNFVRTVSISIPREEAKKLFGKKKKHFFHIKFMYWHNKISISEILLYNKYTLYKNINKIVEDVQQPQIKSKQVSKISKKPILSKCKSYEIMATKLNIRDEPSKHSKILGFVKKGKIVCIYEFNNGWARTDHGWISKSYVKENSVKSIQKTNKYSTPSHTAKTETKNNESTSENSNFGWLFILLILFWIFKR